MMERRVKERLIGATVLVALIVLIVPEMLSGPRQPSAPPLTSGMPAATRSLSIDLTTNTSTAEPDLAEGASAATPPPAAVAASGAASDGASAAASGASAGDGAAATASDSGPPEHGASPSAPTVTTLQAQGPSHTPSGERSASGDSGNPSGSTLETPALAPKSAVGGSAGAQGHRGWSLQFGSFASRANAERLMHQLQARGASSLYVSASGSGPSLRYRVRMGPLADRGAAERAAGKLRAAGHPSTLVAPNS
ncbi:MAG: SPOR domain-containing protein [Steroidobacteraceae bacterium]|jgi:DedD protein